MIIITLTSDDVDYVTEEAADKAIVICEGVGNSEDCQDREGKTDIDLNNDDNITKKIKETKKHQQTICHECGILVATAYLSTHIAEMHYYIPGVQSPHVLCPECGLLCRDHRSYALHKRVHLVCCKQCPAVFKSEKQLSKHGLIHKEERYECNNCEATFSGCYEFIVHKESHEGIGIYTCVKCNHSTSKLELLKRHLKQHDGRKVHTCEVCDKKFFGRAMFNTHMELHSGVKKYTCEYCPKTFSTINYLKTHRELNHHKELYGYELTYPCPECKRVFTFAKSLRRHLSTIHKIGENTTVACSICFKKLANNYNLKVHMRQHTGETPNTCEDCGKGFVTYKSYKKHVLKHHPGMNPVLKCRPKSGPRSFV